MTTVGAFASTVRRQLYGTELAKINTLNGGITTTATTLTVTIAPTSHPGGFGSGSRLEVEDELAYVSSISGSVATVIRGIDNSTAVQHSTGVQVIANPRWPLVDIYDAMKDEIRSWMPHLFATTTIEFTVSASDDRRAWDWTPTDSLFILSATLYPSTTSGTDYRGRELQAVEVRPGQDTAVFASGKAFVVGDWLPDESGTISVLYAKQFALGTFTSATDLESTVLVPASCIDLLRAGVKWRLLADQEASRSNQQGQGESRSGREVEVGAAIGQAEAWRRYRNSRYGEEINSLRTQFPIRIGW